MSPYIKTHDQYTYDKLGEIFDNTDILITPSILYETFGFTVLEALSYGVPVIVSGTVGAKDILVKGAGIVVDGIDSEKLGDVIRKIDSECLEQMNKIIMENQMIKTMDEMTAQIEKKFY